MIARYTLIAAGIILHLYSSIASAEFEVITKTWPAKPPAEFLELQEQMEEDKDLLEQAAGVADNQGAGRSKRLSSWFYKLLHGEQLNPTGRFYLTVGGNLADVKIKNIRNLSYDALAGALLTKTELPADQLGAELAFGYGTSEHTRAEINYLYNRNKDYNVNPLFSGRAESLNSKVRTQVLLLNGYYDFSQFYFFQPYLGFGLGSSMAKVKTRLQNGVGDGGRRTKRKLGFAYSLNVGARFRFWSRFILNAGYKLVILGKANWQDSIGTLNLKGRPKFSGFSFGLTYLL